MLKDSALALSGGQQQRLCIARALAVKPAVIMLDEPCASLDPISTASIEELLLELSTDYTIVIVTHNLAQAKRISDKVAFFLMGASSSSGCASGIRGAGDAPRPPSTSTARSASCCGPPQTAPEGGRHERVRPRPFAGSWRYAPLVQEERGRGKPSQATTRRADVLDVESGDAALL